jgi:hypothetical protein
VTKMSKLSTVSIAPFSFASSYADHPKVPMHNSKQCLLYHFHTPIIMAARSTIVASSQLLQPHSQSHLPHLASAATPSELCSTSSFPHFFNTTHWFRRYNLAISTSYTLRTYEVGSIPSITSQTVTGCFAGETCMLKAKNSAAFGYNASGSFFLDSICFIPFLQSS